MAQVTRKPTGMPDLVDAEQIQEMLDSPGWRWVKHALEAMRDSKMRDLVRPHSEVETASLRGGIEALDRAIAMPDALISEARKTSQRRA